MTVSKRDVPDLHLYVAPEVWPAVELLLEGFSGKEDDLGTVVGTARSFSIEMLPATTEAERLLDRHWIVHLRSDAASRRGAERSFFDTIADHYESEVDGSRNRSNLRVLLRSVDVGPGQRVLDFGCGPGLSVRAADELALVGCDVSSEMRRHASVRGLATVGPEELPGLEGTFDAVVASYVLHLAVPAEDWLAAARCVRRGGRIAANFHKGNGLVQMEQQIDKEGLFAAVQSASLDHELHGPIRAWERIR